MDKLKKYFALTRLGVLETLQWRLALFVMVLGNLLYLTLIYFLWKAIFASAGTDVVNGMTFEMTMVYLVLATAGTVAFCVTSKAAQALYSKPYLAYVVESLAYHLAEREMVE